ncbi:MAG: hypothetical protein K6G54_03800, partial [Oscillospiraceae bacterium]|nr:hypothetical protein [Oscillospiraceae bacterium]
HMGVLYYQAGTYANGKEENATLVLAPTSVGSGIIRLQDTNTNGFFDVAYTVTEAAEGINVFNDTSVFRFYNDAEQKQAYDPKAAGGQNWRFDSAVDAWGADETAPYRNDLARGKTGASFTFETKAEEIELSFSGTVKVESTFPGFAAQTVQASGGNGDGDGETASVRFGKNDTNYTHIVTVTVLSGAGGTDTAAFDRVVERFGSAGTPVPAADAASPHIYWSRSFPDTASVAAGPSAEVRLTAYILDDGELAFLSLNDETVTADSDKLTVHSDGYWELPVTVRENGVLRLSALDTSGNRTAQSVTVDWFNSTLSAGASAQIPTLETTLCKTDREGTAISPFANFTKNDRAFIDATATPSDARSADGDASVSVSFITLDDSGSGLADAVPVTKWTEGAANGMYPMAGNGWYLVTARNPEPHSDEFAAVMVEMDRIDTNVPVVTLSTDESAVQTGTLPLTLDWAVTKQNTGTVRNTIQSVCVNGAPLTIAAGQTELSGGFPASYGGRYTVVARDSAEYEGESTYTLENVPIRLAEGKTAQDLFTVQNAAADAALSKANGTLTLSDLTKTLVGGTYLSSLSADELKAGNYVGSYAWKLVEADASATGEALSALLAQDGWSTEKTLSGLTPGHYVLYVRDAQEPTNAATVASFTLLVGDETLSLSTVVQHTTDQDAQAIDWTTTKGEGAVRPVTEVAVNGYAVYTDNGNDAVSAEGSFPVSYAGVYRFSATDGENRAEQEVVIAADEMPIRAVGTTIRVDDPLSTADDATPALVTLYDPWNQSADNGSIRIDPSVLVGGSYDADASNPAENNYKGGYEWTLYLLEGFDRNAVAQELAEAWLKEHPEAKTVADIPAADLEAIEAEVERLCLETAGTSVGAAWSSQTAYDGLKAGAYRLLIRDKQAPESTNALSVEIDLESDAIVLTAEGIRASGAGTNGQVSVSAVGGYGRYRTYEFILRPIPSEDAVVSVPMLDDALDPEQYPDQSAPAWLPAKLAENTAPDGHVFTGLRSGWYQVAVRAMLGVTLDEMMELTTRYCAYTEAQERLNAAEAAAEDSARAKTVKQRLSAIEDALRAWRNAADTEKAAAWQSYLDAFEEGATQLEATVAAAFDAWQAKGFAGGAEKTAYADAVRACVTAQVTDETDAALSAAQTEALDRQTAYEDMLGSLQSKAAAYYADDSSQYWANAATATVYVDYRSSGSSAQTNAISYPDDGTVQVTFS